MTYVVFGNSDGFSTSIELSSLDGDNGFVLRGNGYYASSGRSVSTAGDVNGDGYDDIIVGAPSFVGQPFNAGRGYVVFGSSDGFSASIELSSLGAGDGFVLNGASANDLLGYSVSDAGM